MEPLWKMNWPKELKPIPRPIQQQIDDGFWSPDTRLQAIADARASINLEEVEWDTWYDNATAFNELFVLLDALTEEERN